MADRLAARLARTQEKLTDSRCTAVIERRPATAGEIIRFPRRAATIRAFTTAPISFGADALMIEDVLVNVVLYDSLSTPPASSSGAWFPLPPTDALDVRGTVSAKLVVAASSEFSGSLPSPPPVAVNVEIGLDAGVTMYSGAVSPTVFTRIVVKAFLDIDAGPVRAHLAGVYNGPNCNESASSLEAGGASSARVFLHPITVC